MRRGLKSTVAMLCTVVSLPGAAMGLLTLALGALDACHRSTPTECAIERVISAGLIPTYFFAWVAYFTLVWRWVDDRVASRRLALLGTAAALAYPLGFWAMAGGSPIASLTLLLPVLLAVLLACCVVGVHLLAPRPHPTLRDAPSFSQDADA